MLLLNMVMYCHPNDLFKQLVLLPKLKTLEITSISPCISAEWQVLDTLFNTHVTFPNLRLFGFEGMSTYLEAPLPGLATPLLEGLQSVFLNRMTFSVPCLLSCRTTPDIPKLGTPTLASAVPGSSSITREFLYVSVPLMRTGHTSSLSTLLGGVLILSYFSCRNFSMAQAHCSPQW